MDREVPRCGASSRGACSCGACTHWEPSQRQKPSPSVPSQVGNPQTPAWSDLNAQSSWREPGHTHTHTHTHTGTPIAVVVDGGRESARE